MWFTTSCRWLMHLPYGIRLSSLLLSSRSPSYKLLMSHNLCTAAIRFNEVPPTLSWLNSAAPYAQHMETLDLGNMQVNMQLKPTDDWCVLFVMLHVDVRDVRALRGRGKFNVNKSNLVLDIFKDITGGSRGRKHGRLNPETSLILSICFYLLCIQLLAFVIYLSIICE